jgi:xanthine/uracil/vitamin C permease (AzgA family)
VFISYTLVKLFHRKAGEVHPLMYIVSLAFVVTFILPYLQGLVD